MIVCFGCQKSVDKNGNEMDEAIFTFAFIKKAPEATEKQNIDKVIKVYFNENDSSLDKGFAIDVANNEIYSDPSWTTLSVDTFDEPMPVNNVQDVLQILEKYNVQDWKKDYTVENPDDYADGFSWRLWLQLVDGTVEKHGGSGTEDGITPENFDGFAAELEAFVEGKLKDIED